MQRFCSSKGPWICLSSSFREDVEWGPMHVVGVHRTNRISNGVTSKELFLVEHEVTRACAHRHTPLILRNGAFALQTEYSVGCWRSAVAS
jgi:hypothetical protein